LQNRVFVTGIGIISAIGNDIREVQDSLISLRSGIGHLTGIDSVYKNEIPVAEIKLSNSDLLPLANPVKNSPNTRTALLALIAARQAIRQSGIESLHHNRSGLISGTTVGGMDLSEKFYKRFLTDHSHGRLRNIFGHDCGDHTETLARTLGVGGFISTINTACSSSANAIMTGARMIRSGLLDRALTGGTDALTLFTLNGFNSLMILDREPCRPLDETRNGLNLGEGAGFLVLESEELVRKSGKPVLAEVSGYGNACDAYHQTASSPEGNGAFLSMQLALGSAGLDPANIDYINAHGTGTRNNDLSEGIAVERIFGSRVPAISSTKSYTGHTLGAAGAIEAVISIMALINKNIYPNLRFSHKMNELTFLPETELITQAEIRHVMSNSFGFGGNNSTLIFSRA
jgi:3-oxoacyl-[acyl-carrier-protein] synthase-1